MRQKQGPFGKVKAEADGGGDAAFAKGAGRKLHTAHGNPANASKGPMRRPRMAREMRAERTSRPVDCRKKSARRVARPGQARQHTIRMQFDTFLNRAQGDEPNHRHEGFQSLCKNRCQPHRAFLFPQHKYTTGQRSRCPHSAGFFQPTQPRRQYPERNKSWRTNQGTKTKAIYRPQANRPLDSLERAEKPKSHQTERLQIRSVGIAKCASHYTLVRT